MKKRTGKILVIAGFILFALIAGIIYFKWVSPTRIGFINYPDYMFAEFHDANSNSFIKIERINWKKKEKVDLKSFNAVYIFGRGLRLPPERMKKLRKAVNDGLPVYIGDSSNQKTNITSITGKQLEYIQICLDNRSRTNFKHLLNYTRREINGKKLFSDPVKEPVIIPHDGFFHTSKDDVFETLEKYQAYRSEKNLNYPGAPKICFLTSTSRPSAEHIRTLVKAFEKKKINIYPIFGFRKRLDFIRKINPELVVLMPHGRFDTMKYNEVINYLKKRNIPLLCPIKVHAPYDKWLKDQCGMAGGIMSQSITMPELDGGIMPFVLSAQFKNKHGLYVFKALPERIKTFTETVFNYLTLRRKANKNKKLVIIYYKGPGRNALAAAGLEVVPSLYNTLKNLQKAGYNLKGLPENTAELEKLIQEKATVFNPYAKGNIHKFVNDPETLLVPVPEYLNWVKQTLPTDLYAEVERHYGKAPGNYMSIEKNGVSNIALASLRFGNVVLMPQSLPAIGSDTNKIIHGAKKAPPHPYIATYLWARFGFKTDAIIHFGTHGSLEFTPWKQVALSSYDWADVLIGNMPHFYIYTINNIGEAIIAKRRGYAALISHLTPPFMPGDLYEDLQKIHDKIHDCIAAGENKHLRKQYEASIIKLIKKKKIDRELQLGDLQTLDNDSLHKIHNYIHELESAKINRGLYVLGRKYSDSEASETARLMAVDAIAVSLANVDIIKGKLTEKQKADAHLFDKYYLAPAHKIIDKLFRGIKVEKCMTPKDFKNLKASENNRQKKHSVNLMAMMGSLKANAAEAKRKQQEDKSPATSEEKKAVKAALIKNCKIPGAFKFICSLQKQKTFDKVSSLTSPRNLSRARRIAELIPRMKKTIDMATAPDILPLINLIQKPKLKTYLFELLKDKDIKNIILTEQKRQLKQRIKLALDNDHMKALYLCLNPQIDQILSTKNINDMDLLKIKIKELKDLNRRLVFIQSMNKHMKAVLKSHNKNAPNFAKIMKTSQKSLTKAIAKSTKAMEKAKQRYNDYIYALNTAYSSMKNVCEYKKALLNSTDIEAGRLINALNGGYIPPSSGADPIRNPNSIPTGRNLFSIDTESTPTREAWKTGVQLGDALINNTLKTKGEYPKKVAFTLWGGEFIRSHGTNVAEILYMLGVEPVWSSRGRVKDVRLIPMEKLKRPRIDVIVQTSGQFRGAATSRLYLIDKAVRMAANADDDGGYRNNVRKGTLAAEKIMIAKGYSPLEARTLSTARIFGGTNGNFGTDIAKLVEAGDKWEKEKEIANQYLKNMGAIYTRDNWCEFKDGLFEAAMQNTDTVVQPRSSNAWGPLSLDHVYEFMGGMNLTVKKVTGNSPDTYFNDLRTPDRARVQSAKEAAMVEARTTILNPKFIKEMMQEGASAAESFAEISRNSYAWEAIRPEMLDDYYWEDFKKTVIDDKFKLGTRKFFDQKNPYALQEVTAVMLETVRKGYWKADIKTQKELAELHAKLIKKYDAGCSGFVCGNKKLNKMISKLIENKELKKDYQKKLTEVRQASFSKKQAVKGMELKKVEPKKKKVEELLKENAAALITIGVIILLLFIAVIYGGRRKQAL